MDDQRAIVRNATYTTCQRRPGPSWMPDWILRASSISLDQEEEVGHAEGSVLSFKGVPILPVPAISFPLGDKRKSGVLPPTIGIDSRSGLEVTLPYYWNIAPNRDATVYPTVMTKRGIDLGAEFRYLEPSYYGTVRGDYLPNDRLRDLDRWGFAAQHAQSATLPLLGPSSLSLNLNRVSDDNYWRDFSRSSASLTQRLLANDGILGWGWAGINFSGRIQRWQTLQDPDSPIVPPYDRAPQLTGRWTRSNFWGGFDSYVEGDYTHFTHSITDPVRNAFPTTPEVTQPDGQRSYLVAQVSRPWQAPGWFVIPKAQVHSRYYAFDTPLTATSQHNATVTVPTFSLDSGLVLERDTTVFGRQFLQTLEPRAFYVYTPFRDQNNLPNYDSAQVDFNFATIYSENQYGGNDRIADNNLLTLGVNTRFLHPETGAEAAKFGIAQRIRFSDQNVVLPGQVTPVSERLSDVLFGASVNYLPRWSADALLQYNYKSSQSIRSTFGVRYSPGSYRTVSLAYRRQQGQSEQIDVGWQWPLNDLWGDRGQNLGPGMGEGEGRWYSVGRLNYSLKESRLVDGIMGLEYDAGCWIGRIVLERMQAGTDTNKRILFQLEFVGFSRLGSNALQTLKQNIPRYQFLRERVTTPSRFSNYD